MSTAAHRGLERDEHHLVQAHIPFVAQPEQPCGPDVLGERLTFVQLGHYEQGLFSWAESPPSGAGVLSVDTDGAGGQVQSTKNNPPTSKE